MAIPRITVLSRFSLSGVMARGGRSQQRVNVSLHQVVGAGDEP